jgi:hypothetical protein
MAVHAQPDRTQYRLIITRRGATEVLLSTEGRLPSLDVLAGTRFAEQLVTGAREKCRLETYCLFAGGLAPSSSAAPPDRFAVMQTIHHDDPAPNGTAWTSSTAAASGGVPLPADQVVLRGALEELARKTTLAEAEPFARPGWIGNLFRWVQGQIEPLGLSLTGAFEQLNAAPSFSLLRIETTGTAVWFKAVGEPNARERAISVALGRLFPSYVPPVLGVHPVWNGWLTAEAAGPSLGASSRPEAWAGAVRALGELQIASITSTELLLESGCRDLRLDQLARQVEPFLTRTKELMAVQVKQSPRILTDSEIRFLGNRLIDALGELGECGIPDTLGHLDPNPQNIMASPNGCCFLDWAEGSVTHPFFTFEYVCEHASRAFASRDEVRETLLAAYLPLWQPLFLPDTLASALSLTPLLAVFACAANSNSGSPESFENPAFAGYFRSLARRAYREAEKLAARSDRCLS